MIPTWEIFRLLSVEDTRMPSEIEQKLAASAERVEALRRSL